MDPLDFAERLAPTVRPHGRPAGYQKWRNLLFVHWRLDPDELRPLIPPQLTVDTFGGSAWVGLVPFHMTGVRPAWSPPVPGISTFHETNIRTYVHLNGTGPGVWFFSLDAANSLAVRIARSRWHLPYFRARMNVTRGESRVFYDSERLWPGRCGAASAIEAEIGASLGTARTTDGAGTDAIDSLEFFLVERYLLYTRSADGSLWKGQVNHAPYPLRDARVECCSETLTAAARVRVSGPPEHVVFSDGVDVEAFGLRPVTSPRTCSRAHQPPRSFM